ncbi:MAG: hypothetical protein F4205_11225 [Gemmatimonadetes bacterium]|nr:hypothetical protein [Gemmatimonadota bacterium]
MGLSIRSTSRITGVSNARISILIHDLGEAASDFQDGELRNLTCRWIECDEIWCFCCAKEHKVPPERQGQFGYVFYRTLYDVTGSLSSLWGLILKPTTAVQRRTSSSR